MFECVVADLDSKAQRCRAPGARPAGLRGYSEPRVTRPRPQMILGVNHSRAIVTGIFPRIYDKGNIHRSKGHRSAMTEQIE